MTKKKRAGESLQMPFDSAETRIAELKRQRLTWLNFQGLGLTSVPEEIFELKTLTGIDLSGNRLRAIDERLWNLPRLVWVQAYDNPLERIPNRPGLTIDLAPYLRHRRQGGSGNLLNVYIRAKSPDAEVAEFVKLADASAAQRLTIGELAIRVGAQKDEPSSAIRSLLESLPRFEFLEELNLRGMRLGTLPEVIRHLPHLKRLDVSGLHLRALPEWLSQLPLDSLEAVDNGLDDIPDSYRKLRKLRHLDLAWNPLGVIPEFIFTLPNLETLRLHECRLRKIPEEILQLTALTSIDVEGNDIDSPPPEVTEKGLDAIRDYWRQRADKGVDYLCEAKLIILGEPGAGKTTLAKKISNPSYKLRSNQKSTEGIDVIRYRFPTAIRTGKGSEEKILQREFQANIWDFGGQEIYHATHQFFLTRRSVYVLVCDDRKEDTDFSYWLHVVEMLTDASPLLIVQNEKQDRTRDINLSTLRARFGNLRGSRATNLATKRGLPEVIKEIRRELESLPHVGVGLPATWKRVRQALERNKHDFVTLETYLDICQKHGFTRREDKLQLSGYLHDLGICLHFQDDPLLKNTVVLKPSWGTDAVYGVLDDPTVIANRGQFSKKDLTRIWSKKKYTGMHDELLRLMMKFQLCYELETSHSYIAPQLLSSEQPPFEWDPNGDIVLRYEYEFMPKGILTRLIVATHHLIAEPNLVWKTGIVLERDGTRAQIVEEYSRRRIRVRVKGPDPRGLLAIVDYQLARLHASFPRMQYDRFLPCPCSECRSNPEPYGFAVQKLRRMADKRQPIQCHDSGEMIDAARLMEDLLLPVRIETRRDGFTALSQTREPAGAAPHTLEVFVSYAWNDDSRAIVERLQSALGAHGIKLLRDREEVRYKDSIRDFMRRMGKGKCVVAVISEKYLTSENCMFELLQVAQAPDLRERIFPLVLADADIYKSTSRVKYVRHWEEQAKKLDAELKTIGAANVPKLQEDLTTLTEIRRMFDSLTDTLRDMNALTPDQHQGSGFDELIQRIQARLAA